VTARAPFLAVPVKARISDDGLLLSADPPIWRLHVLAGGGADGPLAIPGLAALAAMAARTRMRVERAVRAADEESDVELWVEAIAEPGGIQLLVTGWRDLAPADLPFRKDELIELTSNDSENILIDADMRVIRAPSIPGENIVGDHLGRVFVLQVDEHGQIPVVNALTERRGVDGQPVILAQSCERYLLTLSPQFGGNGAYLGHAGILELADEPEVQNREAQIGGSLPMGRQFASVLKQPLSRIVANAETIGSRVHGPLRDNYAEYAQDIANAARHLTELVSDMEDLEAIDRPDFAVARDRIELGDLARRVAGLLALKAADHGITLVLPPEADEVAAVGEFRRVLQILLNLVGNAIRYAPDGSTITLQMEKQASHAAISVADQGKGVPAEDRERVFEKFERLGRSGDGGSGLGLYISRRLARAMGGDLTVSDAPAGGAMFKLTLPAR
jgi:Histidine kinase-, DNA gyrase B-, and HSP90-like ATPase/His Kinase A (phospho-acceptor) domain